ncbi:hypothetical protein BDN72DRAFT_782419 [Pluteus cervinus]|uniref:Uncharacterized protein n=1 Tax=Pluteus cervinus TaxID=181527 RepID=A0ACD2ZYL8_9AGAR|nr:hypothetical protein BDN72DRAFT_782419 [Pluteus cervinus]
MAHWQTLKNATEYFSRADTNISHVIRTIDRIDDNFTNAAADTKLNLAIRSAILCGKKTLNRYYSRTDMSVTYRIATILNPSFKLAYFKDRKWPTVWIDEAIRVLREEYESHYAASNLSDELESGRQREDPKGKGKGVRGVLNVLISPAHPLVETSKRV